MRRRVRLARSDEILVWGLSGKGAVWSVVVVDVGEVIDVLIEAVEALRQVVAGIELVTPGALRAFDGAVELRAFGWEHEEREDGRVGDTQAFAADDRSDLVAAPHRM